MSRKRLTPEGVAKRYGIPLEVGYARLEAAGFKTKPGEKLAPFSLAVLPQVSPEVAGVTDLATELAGRIVARLRGAKWHSKLSGVLMCPLIIDPRIGSVEDFVRVRRGGALDIGSNIDFFEWLSASTSKKNQMLADCFTRGFDRIKSSILLDSDRTQVTEAIRLSLSELVS